MVARTIILFFLGMTLLGLTVIVVETWWVVAIVGITHMTASVVLGTMVWRHLDREERDAEAAERRGT